MGTVFIFFSNFAAAKIQKKFDMKTPTVNVYIDETKKKKDGQVPLNIVVTYNGTRAKESTHITMSISDYKKGLWKRVLRKRLNEIDDRIDELLSERRPFTAKECLGKTDNRVTFEKVLIDMARVKKLRPSSVKCYRTVLYSLKQYFGDDFLLTDLTQTNIQGYARATKVQPSTMCHYLKSLSAILTYAEDRGFLKENVLRHWKYKGDGYKITDKPKSVTRGDVTVIIQTFENTKNRKMMVASGTWLSAFYFCGLALVDLVRVDWDNLESTLIGTGRYYQFTIRRQKTNEIASVMTPVFPLTEKLHELMKTHPWENHTSIHAFGSFVNRYCQMIIPDLTYYQARHTFASLMVASRTPVNIIASMMGRSVNGIATYVTRVTESRTLASAADSLKRMEIFETPPEDLFE